MLLTSISEVTKPNGRKGYIIRWKDRWFFGYFGPHVRDRVARGTSTVWHDMDTGEMLGLEAYVLRDWIETWKWENREK